MSQLEVDKIIPQSGTTLTIGDSGDTISFASGVLPSLESLTITGDLTVDTDTFKVDSTNNRVGIGTTSPSNTLELNNSGNYQLRLKGAGTQYAELGIDDNNRFRLYSNGAERMRIDSSGNVGIGTSSPANYASYNTVTLGEGGIGSILQLDGADSGFYHLVQNNNGSLILSADTGNVKGSTTMIFAVDNVERMRIQSNGALKIGTPAPTSDLPGLGNNDQGVCFRGADVEQFFINSNNAPAFFGRTVDGTIVSFQSAGTQEGTISISGTTTSYNGFTGTHWSRLIDNSKPTILKGTILESLDEMMDWYQVQFDITETDDEGNETTRTQKQSYALGDGESVGDVITYNYEGTDYQATIIQEADVKHTKAKISDTVDAKNVYGVFMAWDNDDDTVNDMYVAQTGSYIIRINGSETVSKGDLIQSNGDGTGKVQSDDIIRASTVAKVISSTKVETYDDGSYTVPCTLHC